MDTELDETFGEINRADIRKGCIENIVGILSSHKFPDSYALRFRDQIAQLVLVSSIHEERNIEVNDSAQVGQSPQEFKFPCIENRTGPVKKR
jgi:hypothetical protein